MKATEYKANCYAGYTWRVFANNRFAGYVVALSETNAMKAAQEKYGKYIWVERIAQTSVGPCSGTRLG